MPHFQWFIILIVVSQSATSSSKELGSGALETDPVSTALGARTVTVHAHPRGLGRLALSAVVFSAEFPDLVTRVVRFGQDDIEWRVAPSFGLGLDYFVHTRARGLFLGFVALQFHNQISRGGEDASFHSLNLIPRVGYRWFPRTGSRIYLSPFVGLRMEVKLAGENRVDGRVFEPTRVAPFATFHMGIHL